MLAMPGRGPREPAHLRPSQLPAQTQEAKFQTNIVQIAAKIVVAEHPVNGSRSGVKVPLRRKLDIKESKEC